VQHVAQAISESAMTDGEVRRIDKDAQKITLRHGPITNLGMPAMTMVFQIKDPSLIDKVNPGDKVKFNAEKVPDGYAVTKIEVVK
jgi:Cu(I)/Ag(I) efflux system protein CusF